MFDIEFEIWLPIPSDPTLLASSWGRIRIADWITHQGRKFFNNKPTFGLWDDSTQRFIYVRRGHTTRNFARLVCEAFHGPAPTDKNYCIHLNENSRDNRPDNLKWSTQKENLNMPKFVAYCHSRAKPKEIKPKKIAKWKVVKAEKMKRLEAIEEEIKMHLLSL